MSSEARLRRLVLQAPGRIGPSAAFFQADSESTRCSARLRPATSRCRLHWRGEGLVAKCAAN